MVFRFIYSWKKILFSCAKC